MKFIQRLFGIEDQKQLIESKFAELQDKFSMQLANFKNENSMLKNEIHKKEAHIKELSNQIRIQNEGDLLLECEKIKKRLVDGDKKEDIDLSAYQSLRASAEAQQRMMFNQGLSGLLGGAGSGLFR